MWSQSHSYTNILVHLAWPTKALFSIIVTLSSKKGPPLKRGETKSRLEWPYDGSDLLSDAMIIVFSATPTPTRIDSTTDNYGKSKPHYQLLILIGKLT